MNSIGINNSIYTTDYDKQGTQKMLNAMYRYSGRTDSFAKNKTVKNNKIEKNNKTKTIITTIGLMAISAFAAYKGKGVIQKALSSAGKQKGKLAESAKKHFPNLSQAGSSFIKACKSPINAITKIFKKK